MRFQVSNLLYQGGNRPPGNFRTGKSATPGQQSNSGLSGKPPRDFVKELLTSPRPRNNFTSEIMGIINPKNNKSTNPPAIKQPKPEKITKKTFKKSLNKYKYKCLPTAKREEIIKMVNHGSYEIKSWQAEKLAKEIINKNELPEFGKKAVKESLGLKTQK
ncbi:MAG TPA: hypothetical protein PLR18_01935 [bacterium]|nr:hypothetical protein [bacterium]